MTISSGLRLKVMSVCYSAWALRKMISLLLHHALEIVAQFDLETKQIARCRGNHGSDKKENSGNWQRVGAYVLRGEVISELALTTGMLWCSILSNWACDEPRVVTQFTYIFFLLYCEASLYLLYSPWFPHTEKSVSRSDRNARLIRGHSVITD